MKIKLIYLLIFPFLYTHAQINLPYFERNIAPSNYLNPSHIPDCKIQIGIPVLNGFELGAKSNGFSFNDITSRNVNGDTLSPNLNFIENNINNINSLHLQGDISLFFVGIKYRFHYFNFSIRERFRIGLSYNSDFIQLALQGNHHFINEPASLKGTNLFGNYFRQYSFGYANEKTKYLTYGLHMNILFGKAHASTLPFDAELSTNPNTFALNFNGNSGFKSSLPFIQFNPESMAFAQIDESLTDVLLNRKNKGFSIDAGLTYRYNDNTSLYASITNLGLIQFKTNTSNLEASGNFYYEGPDFSQNNLSGFFQNLLTSWRDSIEIESTRNESYVYTLKPRVYIGSKHTVTDDFSFNLLAGSNISFNYPIMYLGIHGKYNLGRHLSLLGSWSYSNKSIRNIGTGMILHFRNFNFHLVSDNITGIIWPLSAKNVNLRFGFNLTFGCKKDDGSDACGCNWTNRPKSYRKNLK